MYNVQCYNVIWTPSPNYEQRIDQHTGKRVSVPTILVMHYTVSDLEQTISYFQTNGTVSSHYLVAKNGSIYQFVKEEYRAWHAGVGSWGAVNDVNTYFIGIEHENGGYKTQPDEPAGVEVCGSTWQWYPYTDAQIQASIELSKDIVTRYGIQPINVIGHQDLAPTRKTDPGPLFPWPTFAEYGMGASVDNSDCGSCKGNTDVGQFQNNLRKLGFTQTPTSGKLDQTTRDCVRSFQLHFLQMSNDKNCQLCIAGDIDSKSACMLQKLLSKYIG